MKLEKYTRIPFLISIILKQVFSYSIDSVFKIHQNYGVQSDNQTILISLNSTSSIKCMSRCLKMSNCFMVYFPKDSNICTLLMRTENILLTYSLGSHFYLKYDENSTILYQYLPIKIPIDTTLKEIAPFETNFIIGYEGPRVRIYDITTGLLNSTYAVHLANVILLTVTENFFITCAAVIRFWDRLTWTSYDFNTILEPITLSSNDTKLIGVFNYTQIKIWNINNFLLNSPKFLKNHNETVYAMVYLKSDFLVIGSSYIEIWNLSSFSVSSSISRNGFILTALDDIRFVVYSGNGEFGIYNALLGRLILRITQKFMEVVDFVVLKNGDFVVGSNNDTYSYISIRNSSTGLLKKRFSYGLRSINSLAALDNGHLVVSTNQSLILYRLK
ncbi:unnamed protein product [Brachionus calyciflorus]|uniref:Uncharacterized protein n=1 Tax=Brachionus calyciflorus TaxID=104777 RepID=A0A814JZS8_9BILA|nr:unnamed protein product [Brachionus calyciflorus]